MVTARRRGRGPKTGEGSKVGGTCNSLPQPSGNPRDGIVRVVFPPGMLLTPAAAAGGADDFLTRQVTRLGSSRAPRGATRSGRRCVGYPPHGARAVLGPDYFEIRLHLHARNRLPPEVARVGTRRRARGTLLGERPRVNPSGSPRDSAEEGGAPWAGNFHHFSHRVRCAHRMSVLPIALLSSGQDHANCGTSRVIFPWYCRPYASG